MLQSCIKYTPSSAAHETQPIPVLQKPKLTHTNTPHTDHVVTYTQFHLWGKE